MENIYEPDGWSLISGKSGYYVFGSWSGGYLDGDNWRRNSGIVRYTEDESFYYFYGNTGSCYQCSKKFNHITTHNMSVLSSIISGNTGSKVISIEDFITEFKEFNDE